jgi:hypothetical protein
VGGPVAFLISPYQLLDTALQAQLGTEKDCVEISPKISKQTSRMQWIEYNT